MPKIIIKEYDNTKTGLSNYENFSVVIPGFVKDRMYVSEAGAFMYGGKTVYKADSATAEDKGVNVFDENGIYECTSQDNFKDFIGLVYNADIPAKCAEITVLYDEQEPPQPRIVTEEEFNGIYKNQVYTWEIITDETQKKPGKFIVNNEVGWFKLIGPCETYSPTVQNYVVCETGNEGRDGIQNGIHYGNQMTYKLLELGYTVLYKKLTNLATDFTDDNFEALKDRSAYDFRYISTGGYCDNDANKVIVNVAANLNNAKLEDVDIKGRGDCFALIDIDETTFLSTDTQKQLIEKIKNQVNNQIHDCFANNKNYGKYAAICTPRVIYNAESFEAIDAYSKNCTMPASFHYLACAAYAFKELNYNEWFAVAGYDRGICNWKINGTTVKLGDIAINYLEPRKVLLNGTEYKNVRHAVNIISSIRGNYYLWGNRTAYELGNTDDSDLVASHFLNIRQLCCTLKKDLYVKCRKFTFDPNSDILWSNFCSSITPLLEKMKSNEGIKEYKIIKVKTKTDKKALLTAKIRIVPIEAVEDFDISVYLENSIAGNTVNTEE